MLKALSLIAAVLVALASAEVFAATWNGSAGTDWFNASNWTGTAPQSGGSALINNSGTVNIASPGAISTTLDMLNGNLNISGAGTTLTTSGQVIIGTGAGNPTVTQSAGTVTLNGTNYISNSNDGGADTYNFNGGTFNAANLTVYQWGVFNHNVAGVSPMNITGALNVGTSVTGDSFFFLNGNQMTVGGSLNVGTANNTGTASFGFGGATAKLTLSGGGSGINVDGNNTFLLPNLTSYTPGSPLVVPGQSIIGQGAGFTTFTQQGTNLDFNGILYVSNGNDSKKDQYNYNGGTLQVQNLVVYQWGEFNHNNAGALLDVVGSVSLGTSTTGNSYFNLNGHELKMGGSLNIGTANNTGSGTFDFGAPATAKLTFTGGGSGINVDGNTTFTLPNLTSYTPGTPLVIPGQSIVGQGAGFTTFTQQGTNVDFNNILYISNGNDSKKDQYNYNGGTLEVQNMVVYQWGEFNHNNSSAPLTIVGALSLGTSATGNSFFNLGGNELKIGTTLELGVANNTGSGTFSFGNPGTAKLTFTGVSSGINIYGKSTLVIPTGLVNPIVVPGQSIIGQGSGGESIYQQDGGTVSFNGQLYIANVVNAGGETDKVIVNGGTLNVNGVSSNINLQTRGLIQVNGGTFNAKALNIGQVAGYVAGFQSTGGTSNFAGTVKVDSVGDSQVDYFNVSGGTVNITGAGNDLEFHGTSSAAITGGVVNIADDFLVGTRNGFTATINQSGGRVNVNDALQLATVAGSTGTYNLSGGELKVGGLLTMNLNPGADTFNFSGGSLSAATLQFGDGAFTYTGGFLSPGLLNTPATMTVNGSLLMPAAGGIEFDLAQPNVFGGLNDLLDVNGLLTLDGTLNINAPNGLPVGLYPLITFDSIVNNGLDTNNPFYIILIQLNGAGPGGTVYLATVPEPSSALLMGLGLLGLMARRRKAAAARA